MSTQTAAKAARLRAEGKVERLPVLAAYRIQGDHGTYSVLVTPEGASCSCAYRGKCSHAQAAEDSEREWADRMAERLRASGALDGEDLRGKALGTPASPTASGARRRGRTV